MDIKKGLVALTMSLAIANVGCANKSDNEVKVPEKVMETYQLPNSCNEVSGLILLGSKIGVICNDSRDLTLYVPKYDKSEDEKIVRWELYKFKHGKF